MIRFLRVDQIVGNRKKGITAIIPVSRSSWYDGVKAGRYPKPIKLSKRSVAWKSTDIEALVALLSAGCEKG